MSPLNLRLNVQLSNEKVLVDKKSSLVVSTKRNAFQRFTALKIELKSFLTLFNYVGKNSMRGSNTQMECGENFSQIKFWLFSVIIKTCTC